MTREQILNAVVDHKLFGALEVDIKVPDHLKQTFSEMPPIFKNTDISRDDLGDHMYQYAEERNIMSHPRKALIFSLHGETIMIITPLLNWCRTHGLVVTKIPQFFQLPIVYIVYQYAKLRTLDFSFDFMDVCVFTDSAPFHRGLRKGDTSPFKARVQGGKHVWFPRSDTPEMTFDTSTSDLFKEDLRYSGDGIVALCSKTYFCFGHSDKFCCKSVNNNWVK